MTARSLTDTYGLCYRRAHEAGARPGETLLTYGFRDGSSYSEDVATYFGGPESFWRVDTMACALATGRVLAVGCGIGRHAAEVARAGHEVIGLEPSEDAVAVGRARGVDVRLGGLPHPPPDLGRFDTLLFAGGGLHLLFLPGFGSKVLTALADLANPGARLVGTCPVLPEEEAPEAQGADTYEYRLRVECGDEVTEWSEWGAATLHGPEQLDALVEDTPWVVEEVRRLEPPDVPSYLAVLRLTEAGR
ncbi:MAG TPA: class I SAM-dependent methyltransferase [Pseudonocardiaceae bacterium]